MYILCVNCYNTLFIKEYIIKLLKNKLNYLRKRGSRTSQQKNGCQTPKKRKLSSFTPNPPVLQQSNADSSAEYEANLKTLQKEGEKHNPNKMLVMDLMKKTFYMRRQSILKGPTSVASLLKIFPFLRNYDQVSELLHEYQKQSLTFSDQFD